MFRSFATSLLSAAIALMAVVAQAETLNVHLVSSDSTPPYQQFSAAIKKALAGSDAGVTLTGFHAEEYFLRGGEKADLVVAVGMKALELAAGKVEAPLLAVMVPRASYESLLEERGLRGAVSAIYLDQPWDRQFKFIQAALPKHSVVGVLYSSHTPIALPRLPRGMTLNARTVRSAETLFDSLENILANSDVLLVVPDSEIYSANNVRNILLTSYRHKVPLVGISQAYVNAGALGAIFSTPEQLAAEAGKAIAAFAGNRQLPAPQYPESFTIALNAQVARSLGVALDAPGAIRERMERAQ